MSRSETGRAEVMVPLLWEASTKVALLYLLSYVRAWSLTDAALSEPRPGDAYDVCVERSTGTATTAMVLALDVVSDDRRSDVGRDLD